MCASAASLWLFSASIAHADVTSPRPLGARKLACSFRHPICIHDLPKTSSADPMAVLRAFEHAWDVAVDALDLPPPDGDDATGAYDVYLSSAPGADTATFAASRDPVARFGRASAFTILDASLRGGTLEYAAARSIFRAIALRVSPGTDTQTAESEATALADLVVSTAREHDVSFEAHPERAVSDAWPEAPALAASFADGASFFYSWLDETYANEPGGFLRAAWSLTPSSSPPDATAFVGEPDTFDVLRMTFRPTNGGLDFGQFMLDFAIARAFDPNGAARRDWDIDWPASPRRLAPALPIAPTGSSYVVVRRRGAPPGAHLRIEATWEEHASMLWEAVKLDASGNAIGEMPIAAQHKATNAQMTIENFDGVDAVLLVVVNLGDDALPFDPKSGVWEPHGYLLTVSSE